MAKSDRQNSVVANSAVPPPKTNVAAVLKELSDTYVSHLEEHDRAMQVGGYVPLDDDYQIEVPLRLCRLAYEATTEGSDP